MRAAAAALTFLLAGGAHASTPGPTDTQGPLEAALAGLGTLVGQVIGCTNPSTKVITIDDTTATLANSTTVTTITFNVDPAPAGTACGCVLTYLQNRVKNITGTTDASYTTTAPGCPPITGSTQRRAHQLVAGDVTVTVVKAGPTAAPTTSSPTTSAPTTVSPTTAAPTTSCPDKYGAAVCAPFLQEDLCKSHLGEAWCRASCGRCNECKFADKAACKARDDCKWSKKKGKKACKSKAPKSCVDMGEKKCKKADNCKWSKKKQACRAKNPCKKLGKKKCKKAGDCKWKKQKKSCKAKKKAEARRSASLSATQSDESSSDDSLSDDSSESED